MLAHAKKLTNICAKIDCLTLFGLFRDSFKIPNSFLRLASWFSARGLWQSSILWHLEFVGIMQSNLRRRTANSKPSWVLRQSRRNRS